MEKNITIKEIIDEMNKISEFDNFTVEFMLTKQVLQKNIVLVGLSQDDHSNDIFVYDFNRHMVSDDEIKKHQSRIELYLLNQLSYQGYSVAYMSSSMHCLMWLYIGFNLYGLETMENGIYKYLDFCKLAGISSNTLSYLYNVDIDDIYSYFYEMYYRGYKVLFNTVVDNYNFLLGYKQDKGAIVYGIFILQNDTNELLQRKTHTNIHSAVNDYKNRLYSLSLKIYNDYEEKISFILNKCQRYFNIMEENCNE